MTTMERSSRHVERDRYRLELGMLPHDQLLSLYDAARAGALEDARREESERFFNLPHAAADFDHWSKMEYWSLDEAVALSMGKAPEVVSWDQIKAFKEVSPFVRQYARLRDLTERAKVAQKLFDAVLPTIFIRWADNNEIAVPAELRERVTKRKGTLGDWKKNYEQLNAMYGERMQEWVDLSRKQSDLIAAKQARIAELEKKLAEKQPRVATADAPKIQSPVERQNMLKLIYAMAVKGYAYDPTQKRSSIISEIASDMALAGFSISDDTIRRYLKEVNDNLHEWRDTSK